MTNQPVSDLVQLAKAVTTTVDGGALLSERAAARCLSGVVNLVSRDLSVGEMQRACATLVRDASVWSSGFAVLPREADGRVSRAVEHIAVVARGILPSCGADAMRAALSFWAVESDPVEWQKVTAGAAA